MDYPLYRDLLKNKDIDFQTKRVAHFLVKQYGGFYERPEYRNDCDSKRLVERIIEDLPKTLGYLNLNKDQFFEVLDFINDYYGLRTPNKSRGKNVNKKNKGINNTK